MNDLTLTVGTGDCERTLDRPDKLLRDYRTDDGLRYLDHRPTTPPDELRTEDLAVTILINSRVGPAAWKSVEDNAAGLDLASLPDEPLEATTDAVRDRVADLVADMASWRGFAASVATKVLHKKRPRLVPVLDNQAIFGAYMNPGWPEEPSAKGSVYTVVRIREAIEWIVRDLTRERNWPAWERLGSLEPARSRIELLDMVWWVHFRTLEPVR